MNGRPLLKCLSITFECLLALTSEKHTRWEHTHKHITGGLSLCGHTGEVVFSWGWGLVDFILFIYFFTFPAPIRYFGDSPRTAVGGEAQ